MEAGARLNRTVCKVSNQADTRSAQALDAILLIRRLKAEFEKAVSFGRFGERSGESSWARSG